MALGMNYGLHVKPWETDFSLSFSHQQTKGYRSKYRSEVGTLSASRSFLEEKNLHLSASMSLCYNEVERQSKSLSMGGDISVGYTLKKAHTFSASASFNKYGDVNISKTRSNLDCTDITCSLNYAYTFSLLEIKRKVKE
jgi:hemolysin activation/secretion protein